jgi:ABC-2 type transport system ATP-binding protein
MPRPRRTALLAALTTLAATAAVLAPATSAAVEAPTATDGCLTSVPDAGGTEPVEICYTVFQPGSASAGSPVPMLLEGHGWGGSRQTDPAAFEPFLAAGYGVLSFDQRGFGESGGKAHVMDPAVEGQDVQRLIDVAAGLDWVQQDGPGDPRIGAIGGSYGGGYQYVGALSEIDETGKTRFDALAPEYTWWDINDALAPSGVARSEWLSVLWAIGNASDAHTEPAFTGFVEGSATGNYPEYLAEFWADNGPAFHIAEGRRLDVPVLVRQGISDNLFNLNQALKNLDVLTDAARERSVFVGFHGGHALPAVLPPGSQAGEPVALGQMGTDPCSPALQGGEGDYVSLQLRFFDVHLKGADGTVPGENAYALITPDGDCLMTSTLGAEQDFDAGTVTTPVAAAGAPQYVPLGAGPLTVAGTPYLDAAVTTTSPDARAFFALAVGTTPVDARVVHSNLLPHREVEPVDGVERTIELPAVSVEVPEGSQLFLVVTPYAEMFGAHASRVPGLMTLTDATVRVPVLAADDVVEGGGSTTSAPDADGTGSGELDVAARALPATGLRTAPVAGALLIVAAVGVALVRRRGRVDDEV